MTIEAFSAMRRLFPSLTFLIIFSELNSSILPPMMQQTALFYLCPYCFLDMFQKSENYIRENRPRYKAWRAVRLAKTIVQWHGSEMCDRIST